MNTPSDTSSIQDFANPLNQKSAVRDGAGNHWGSRLSSLLYTLIRWLLGSIFLVSGVSKLSDLQQFAHIIEAYGLISPELVFPAGLGLSLLEVLAGLGLVLDVRYALTTITGQLILFIFILGYGLALGLDVDCGCFGSDDPEGNAFHSLRPALYRDLAMLAGVGFLYFQRYKAGFSPKHCISFFQLS